MVGGCEDLALHDGVNVDCGVKTRRRARVPRAFGSGSSETISSLRPMQHIAAAAEEHPACVLRALSLLCPPKPNTCRCGFIGLVYVLRTAGRQCGLHSLIQDVA